MNYLTKLIFALSLSLPLIAQAGGWNSAGGDGVIVDGKTYVLDLVESGVFRNPRAPYNNAIGAVSKAMQAHIGKSWVEKEVTDIVSSILAEAFEKNAYYDLLFKRVLFSSQWQYVEQDLIDVHDEDFVTDFKNYKLVQLAVRSQSRIYINIDTWKTLDNLNKAALIVHEVNYALAQAMDKNLKSPSARGITAHLFSEKMPTSNMSLMLMNMGYPIPQLNESEFASKNTIVIRSVPISKGIFAYAADGLRYHAIQERFAALKSLYLGSDANGFSYKILLWNFYDELPTEAKFKELTRKRFSNQDPDWLVYTADNLPI